MAKASAKVVFSFATRNRFWFGITMRVSTASCSSLTPASATRARRMPSNWNGFVTTPTVRMPMSRAARAITGAAPVPVPPPMPAVMKAMWAPESWSRISSITSSAAARPTSGCEPAPRPCVTPTPIWMIRAAFDEDSAWASVFATTNSQPRRPASIMLLTALPPAPPIPNTVMRGLSSRMSGACRLMVMIFSPSSRLSPTSARPARLFQPWRRLPDRARTQPVSKALANPLPDLAHVAVRPGALAKAARARLEVLGMRDLRIDEEPDRRREGRPLGGLRHALDAERPTDPDLPLQNLLGEIGKPDELAAAPGQHDPAAGLRGKARVLEALADELEDLLEARLDDAHELRLRQVVRNVTLVLVDLVDGDHVAVVRARRDAGAVERLEALGGGDPGREPARDVHRDVVAAGEDADARRAAAHIDDGDPHLGLVVDERRKAGGVRRRDHRLDAEMAALDREHEVACRRGLGADDVEIDGEALADHAARLDDVGLGVEGIAGRQRMQDGAAGTQGVAARRGKDALHVGRSDRMADADRALEMLRAEPSAGQVDDHRLDLDLRHPLGGVDGLANRAFGGLEIDDGAAFQPERALVADAEDARQVGPPAQRVAVLHRQELGDEADDLARADVEHGKGRALARRQRLHAWRQAVAQEAHVSTPLPRIGFFLRLSRRAAAASSVSRTTTRSGMRRSIAITSFCRMPCSRSSLMRRRSASFAPCSGRRTSRPLSILSVHRRPETSVPARMRLFSGPAASISAR